MSHIFLSHTWYSSHVPHIIVWMGYSILIGQINQIFKFPHDQLRERREMCSKYMLYFGFGLDK